ncbi:MAG TPA: FHA domain-containing protein [Candidatus Thermoplasmatota archaeon]|jgi:DNA-binding transcriptional ArsR family regulator|nr:FHA domain-containing protein [Candidatus Thermoplasmatota archaeon]
MGERPRAAPVNYARLAAFLEALHYPLRLELLDQLRMPKTLGDLKVAPHRTLGGNPDRAAARETVRAHLEKLVEVGLVDVDTVQAEGRGVNRYAVNAQKLYELTEEIRRLSVIYAGRGGASDVTGTVSGSSAPVAVHGPRLVLVHGVYEGKAFPLSASTAPDGRWVIGRGKGLQVSLDYDPFVSVENTVIAERGGRHTVTDLPTSKNGTAVNWTLLEKGAAHELRPGDLIGVGRSLLLFLAE